MPCVNPLEGWFSRERTQRGKRSVVFDLKAAFSDLPVSVPCGQCIGCRLEYARTWAIRCMHEASLHNENCFVTLTYDDKHLPAGGSLRKADFTNFMKRLRSRFVGQRIRFFQSGEYGSGTLRPHHHCLLFGFDFPDKVSWSDRNGYKVWTSDILDETWSHGITELGSVTFESAAYCARYVVSKFRGPKEIVEKYYDGLVPEYATMSLKPGIGADWYAKYGDEVRKFDSVIVNGKEMRPPKYYDRLFEAVSPEKHGCTMLRRRKRFERLREKDGRGSSRLLAEKDILETRTSLLEGRL